MTAACAGAGSTLAACQLANLAEGPNTVYVACRDGNGNAAGAGVLAAAAITVDTHKPVFLSLAPASGAFLHQDNVLVSAGLDEPAYCRWDTRAVEYESLSRVCLGGGTASALCAVDALREGYNTLYFGCTDLLGNRHRFDELASVTYRVDTTAPVIVSGTPATGAQQALAGAVVTFGLSEAATCRWSAANTAYDSMAGLCAGAGAASAVCSVASLGGGTHVFYAACRDAAGNTGMPAAWSVALATAPAAPTGLSASADAFARVTLQWTDVATGETGYVIERKTGAGAYAAVATVPADTVRHVDDTRAASTAFSYRVKATGVYGDSAYSNVAAVATPGFAAPVAPWNVVGLPGDRRVELAWSPVTNAAGYQVFFGTASATYTGLSPNEGASPIYVTTATAVLTGVPNNAPVFAAVKAVGPGGLTSGYSNEARVLPLPLVGVGAAQYGRHSALVRDSAGNLYAAYQTQNSPAGRVAVRKSANGGATWSDLPAVQQVASGSLPALAIDSQDRLHLVWNAQLITGSDTSHQVYYAQYRGGAWSEPQYVGYYPKYDQINPTVLVDASDRLHVLWYGSDLTLTAVFYSFCPQNCDVGGTWSGRTVASSIAGGGPGAPVAAFDAQDRLHVFYNGWDAAHAGALQNQIFHGYCSGDCRLAANWTTPYIVQDLGTYWQTTPAVVIDGTNTIYVLFGGREAANPTNFSLHFTKCTIPCKSAANWSAWTTPYPNPGYYQNNAALVLGGDGKLHALYSETTAAFPKRRIKHAACALPCSAWGTSEVLIQGDQTGTRFADYTLTGARGKRRVEGDGPADFLFMTATAGGYGTHGYWQIPNTPLTKRPVTATLGMTNSDNYQGAGRSLVRTKTGLLYAAYPGGVSRSADEGRTWSAVAVPASTLFRRVALAIDGNDVIHAVYESATAQTGYAQITTTGTAWSTLVTLDPGNTGGQHIVIGSDNRLHVMLAGGKYRTCASACATAANWSAVITLPASSGSLAIDAANVLHHVGLAGSPVQVQYRRCASACSTLANWSAAVAPASTPGYDQSAPSLAVDAAGRLKLAFLAPDATSGIYPNVRYTSCAASCTTAANWAASIALSQGIYGVLGSPQVSLSSAGLTLVTWPALTGEYWAVMHMVACYETCTAADWPWAGMFRFDIRYEYLQVRWSKHFMNGGVLDWVGLNYVGTQYPIVYGNDPVIAMGAAVAQPTPAAPHTLVATSNGAQANRLTWVDASSNEDFFRIERKINSGGTYAQVALLPAGTTAYDDTGLAENTQYYYRVKAGHATAESAYSNEAYGPTGTSCPAAPANLVAATLSSSALRLTWLDSSSNETSFRLERKAWAGAFTVVANPSANAITFDDTGLTAETMYTYRIAAVNSCGPSAVSNESSAPTSQGPPSAPVISALSAGATAVQVTWVDTSTNENDFQLMRSTDGVNFTQRALLTANSTAFLDTGLTTSAWYYYQVIARNTAGQASSGVVSAQPRPPYDNDNDGYQGTAFAGSDCNDADPAVHPGVTDVADGVDGDCDGAYDEDGLLLLLRYYKNWSSSQNVDWEHRFSTQGNNPYAPISSEIDGHSLKIYPVSFGSGATVTRGAVSATRLQQCRRTAWASDGFSNHWTVSELETSSTYASMAASGQWACSALGYVIASKAVADAVGAVGIYRHQSGTDYNQPGEPNPPLNPPQHTSTMYSNIWGESSNLNFQQVGTVPEWYAFDPQ
jgi:hypothetical protein